MSLTDIVCEPQPFDRLYDQEKKYIHWRFIQRAHLIEHEKGSPRTWTQSSQVDACPELTWLTTMAKQYPWAFYGLEHHWDALVTIYNQSELYAETMLAWRDQQNTESIVLLKKELKKHMTVSKKKNKEIFADALKIGMIKARYLRRLEEEPLQWPPTTLIDAEEVPLYT